MKNDSSVGELIARALSGSWRADATPLPLSAEELRAIAEPLLGSGGAALLWRRLQLTDLRFSSAAGDLEQASHYSVLHSLQHERELKNAVGLLRSSGIDPLLVKGWSVARLYPERGLRPYGDVDLCVAPGEYVSALAILERAGLDRYRIDLHRGVATLDRRGIDEVMARSRRIELDGLEVRILSAEDELRVQCIHLLRHGAWRPLWLCDVALLIEAQAPDFDWDLCLGDQLETNWVLSTIGLAVRLLGARILAGPIRDRAEMLPEWLVAAVLRQWNRPRSSDHAPGELMARTLSRPVRLPAAVLKRWPDPIVATINRRRLFDRRPRLPIQLAEFAARTVDFGRRLARSAEE